MSDGVGSEGTIVPQGASSNSKKAPKSKKAAKTPAKSSRQAANSAKSQPGDPPPADLFPGGKPRAAAIAAAAKAVRGSPRANSRANSAEDLMTDKPSGNDSAPKPDPNEVPEAAPKGKADAAAPKLISQSPTDMKRTVSHALGEITWLMTQSQTHKHLLLSDLEWFVMPAILLEQFRIYYAPVPGKAGEQGAKQPAACAIWAKVSPEVEARLKEADARARLTLSDWRSGDKPYLIEVIAPFGGADKVAEEWEAAIGKGS